MPPTPLQIQMRISTLQLHCYREETFQGRPHIRAQGFQAVGIHNFQI